MITREERALLDYRKTIEDAFRRLSIIVIDARQEYQKTLKRAGDRLNKELNITEVEL